MAEATKVDAAASAAVNAITPLDGRYRNLDGVKELPNYFSVASLARYRCQVEIEYFLALTEVLPQLTEFPKDRADEFRNVYKNFGEAEAVRVITIEAEIRHDVKAIEYFLKEEFDRLGFPASCKEFIHFGLTSEDVNCTAKPLQLKDCMVNLYLPILKEIIATLEADAKAWEDIPMLAKTHGQSATPTRLGKEMMVFVERLQYELESLEGAKHRAKFGGATGGMNAHVIAYPDIDWREFATKFHTSQGLIREQYTTQINHYDGPAAIFQNLERVNTILIDLCRDMWQYISMDYFKLAVVKKEVGSSAMPHKVNPIDFENAEGNFGIANALFQHLAQKLPISRLQRDLSDSTVYRNVSVAFGHSLISFNSLKRALGKIEVNKVKLLEDLDNNWAVVAEAIQTILRRESYPNPYEALKELTRGGTITKSTMHVFVDGLDEKLVSADVKAELKAITPASFIGMRM